MKKYVLASSSPRRVEILNNLNLNFETIPSDYEEHINSNLEPDRIVCELAKHKAVDVYSKTDKKSVIIAADTIVYCDGEIFGKPKNYEEAYTMLKKLSGRKHKVLTGICIINENLDSIIQDFEETIVEFKTLSESEILNYISTQEPMDKAGAYGIQGLGGLFVKRIEGCYFNVMGFPVHKFYIMMGKLGVNLLLKDV